MLDNCGTYVVDSGVAGIMSVVWFEAVFIHFGGRVDGLDKDRLGEFCVAGSRFVAICGTDATFCDSGGGSINTISLCTLIGGEIKALSSMLRIL